jgi:hypothetical protein
MTNVQAQFGFQHLGYESGGYPDMALTRRKIQSTYSTIVYFGDPVVKTSGTQYIVQASGTGNLTALAGIFYGCYYVPAGQSAVNFSPWWPGASQTDGTALIMDGTEARFRVAALNTAIPATTIGNNIGYTTGAGGTTLGGGFSTFVVDTAQISTSSTAPFTVVDVWSNIMGSTGNGTDNGNPYNWVVVGFNNQWRSAGQTGS